MALPNLLCPTSPDGKSHPIGEKIDATVWHIKKRVYRYVQVDGSVVVKITYSCPVGDECTEECNSLSALTLHIEHAHGVGFKVPGLHYGIRHGLLPSGKLCLICPECIMQFPLEQQDELIRHLAAEHGTVGVFAGDGQLRGQSEHMDFLHDAPSELWFPRRDEARRRLHLVSLGNFCAMKLSMQSMGLGEAHLPFDWIRSTLAGVHDFVCNNFASYFSVASQCSVGQLKVYRSVRHSFWHDDITQVEVREKIQRRIDRFRLLCDQPRDLLFLRSCATTDELAQVEQLYSALLAQFGATPMFPYRRVLLAVVVDGQDGFVGPYWHDYIDGILFISQPSAPPLATGGPDHQAYCCAIASAVETALTLPEGCDPGLGFGIRGRQCPLGPNMAISEARLRFFDTGLYSGFEGLMSFEGPNSEEVDFSSFTGKDVQLPSSIQQP